MYTHRLDVDALLEEARQPKTSECRCAGARRGSDRRPTRARLNELRTALLDLHKALLDDAKAAYELDRGRISSTGALLQLVIHDSWFAWLHQVSEIVVRIDEMTATEAKTGEADARTLLDQIDRLLVPSETGDTFARRYFEALQRQPAVVLAHGGVKKLLKR